MDGVRIKHVTTLISPALDEKVNLAFISQRLLNQWVATARNAATAESPIHLNRQLKNHRWQILSPIAFDSYKKRAE
jgi:hypothetical protein